MRRMMVLAFGALVSCTGSDDPGEDTGAEPEAEVAFTPVEGDWVEEPVVYVEDGCEIAEDIGGDVSPFVLTVTGSETFEMRYTTEYEDVETVIRCTLVDRAFGCDPLTTVTPFADYGYDATVTVNGDPSGAFSSETEGHVDATITVSCVGADCGTVNPVGDCTSIGGYEIHTAD